MTAYDGSIATDIGINEKDHKQGIYIVVAKLEDICLFLKRIFVLYNVRLNIVILYEVLFKNALNTWL